MIVVFDTNIWKTNLFLKAPAAAAARLYLKQRDARLVIPEVIKLEVEHHLAQQIRDDITALKTSHKNLLRIFGNAREVTVPGDSEITQRVSDFLASVYPNVEVIPFSLESARSALLRIVDKVPPSHRSQQFKDGVIWADCVKLLEQDEVILVTSDGDFYEGNKCENGLARALAREIEGAKHPFKLVKDLPTLLSEVRVAITIDEGALVENVLKRFERDVFGLLRNQEFELGDRKRLKYELFATEQPTRLFLNYDVEFDCVEGTNAGRYDALLRIVGEGSYDTTANRFEDLRASSSSLTWKNKDGAEEKRRNLYAHMEAVLGSRTVIDKIRYPIDGSGS